MSSKVKVEKWQTDQDGDLCEANLKKKLVSQGYQYVQYEFPPGMDFPDHTHSVSKKDAILTGRFQFCMYGETVELEPGDMVEVPANTVHNARVVGNKSVVFFDSTK